MKHNRKRKWVDRSYKVDFKAQRHTRWSVLVSGIDAFGADEALIKAALAVGGVFVPCGPEEGRSTDIGIAGRLNLVSGEIRPVVAVVTRCDDDVEPSDVPPDDTDSSDDDQDAGSDDTDPSEEEGGEGDTEDTGGDDTIDDTNNTGDDTTPSTCNCGTSSCNLIGKGKDKEEKPFVGWVATVSQTSSAPSKRLRFSLPPDDVPKEISETRFQRCVNEIAAVVVDAIFGKDVPFEVVSRGARTSYPSVKFVVTVSNIGAAGLRTNITFSVVASPDVVYSQDIVCEYY